ncbi:hypothetical protein CPB84DRAFT_1748737 [Gymnopilus junonius]|uniref:Uncharacterized protein n=1 Tax=Gymnopilus junonius TaxID=109634 RepID=A0A9P5NHJ7_GYMJU|nr:hypothetical protein CPB84DRAFT_1748737 [Gymnopilus junonius]
MFQHEKALSPFRKEIASLDEQVEKAREVIGCASSLFSLIRTLPSEIMHRSWLKYSEFLACMDKSAGRETETPFFFVMFVQDGGQSQGQYQLYESAPWVWERVEDLKLRGVYDEEGSTAPYISQKFLFSHLRRFRLSIKPLWLSEEDVTIGNVANLHLPMGTIDGLSTWSPATLMNFEARHLESLVLFSIRVQPYDLQNFLRNTPSLQSLLLHLPLDYNLLLKELAGVNGEARWELNEGPPYIFIPNLKKISLYSWRSLSKQFYVNQKALVDAIQTRWSPRNDRATAPARKCLEYVYIGVGQKMSLDDENTKTVLRRERRKV